MAQCLSPATASTVQWLLLNDMQCLQYSAAFIASSKFERPALSESCLGPCFLDECRLGPGPPSLAAQAQS